MTGAWQELKLLPDLDVLSPWAISVDDAIAIQKDALHRLALPIHSHLKMEVLEPGLPLVSGTGTRESRGQSCRSRCFFFAVDHAQHFLRFGPVCGNEFAQWARKPVGERETQVQIARLLLTIVFRKAVCIHNFHPLSPSQGTKSFYPGFILYTHFARVEAISHKRRVR